MKYVQRSQSGTNLVLLAPDAAEAFPTEEAVNQALRLVIELTKVPTHKKRKRKKALSVSIESDQ
jgi:hypothetical protein